MSQAPDFKDMKGKITLTWGDKPTKPAPQAAPAPQTAPAPKPQTPAPQAAPAPKPQAPTPQTAPAPKPQAPTQQTAPAPKPQAPTQQTAPAPKPQAPTQQTAPAPATAEKPTGEIKTKAAPQETQAEAPAQAAETPATTTKKPGKKTSWGAILFDTLLVLMLVGIIGAGAWYMHQQLEQYRVPSPMELAQAEHLELCKQHEGLQNAAYKADEQLHMRQRITNLELQLADVNRQIAELNQGIANERERIHSLQREIRHEDKTSRGVAKSLLIGLPIGNASTVNGRVYPDAHIHRLEAGRITLRTPHGQVRFPVAQLVKENLPDMVRYAFGIDDLVDMSDFEAEPGAPAPRKKRQGKLISLRKPSTQVTEPNYEPAPGAPVLNAQTPPATITVEPGLTPEDDGSWQAPHEPLPIEE